MGRPSKTSTPQTSTNESNSQASSFEEAESDLVEMSKGDETIEVHASCVKAHEDAGWKLSA